MLSVGMDTVDGFDGLDFAYCRVGCLVGHTNRKGEIHGELLHNFPAMSFHNSGH